MGRYTKEDVLRLVEEEDVEFIRTNTPESLDSGAFCFKINIPSGFAM